MDTSSANKGGSQKPEIQQPVGNMPDTKSQGTGVTPLEQAVLEYLERPVPEADKWKHVRELEDEFLKTIKAIPDAESPLNSIQNLKNSIESSFYIAALGDINMKAVRYIVKILEEEVSGRNKDRLKDFLEEYSEICKKAFKSGDASSEPVREQVFLNICSALNIPGYPLERLDKLYNEFKDPEKRMGMDMTVEMNRDIQDEVERRPENKVFIEQQNTFWDTKRIQYVRKTPEEREVVGREWDYWKTMTEKKFLLRQSRMHSLKKLTDEEISFEDMKKENDKLSEIRSWKMN